MNTETAKWSRRYQTALCKHLEQGPGASLQPAFGLGREAVALGLETLDLAKIHKQALMALVSPGGSSKTRQKMIELARNFFAETIVPIEKTHRAALKNNVRVNQLTQRLCRRTMESSASARRLERDIAQRQVEEAALKKSGIQHTQLLAEAHRLQRHLRHLTRASLSTQEDARQKISRQLHDEIAQTLLAINLRLLTLKTSAKLNTESLKKEIDKTQQLVKESAKSVNQFAHEFVLQHKT